MASHPVALQMTNPVEKREGKGRNLVELVQEKN